MKKVDRRRFYQGAMMAVMALMTVILLFTVVLLYDQMVQSGHHPLAFDDNAQATAPAYEEEDERERADIVLYFTNGQGDELVAEKRRIPITKDTGENCRMALDELIAGPQQAPAPVLSPSTLVRGVYLLDTGELVVDFSLVELRAQFLDSCATEVMMVYAVANTLTQEALHVEGDPQILQVRFLFEGSPQEAFPAHLDVSRPVLPDPRWIAPSNRGEL